MAKGRESCGLCVLTPNRCHTTQAKEKKRRAKAKKQQEKARAAQQVEQAGAARAAAEAAERSSSSSSDDEEEGGRGKGGKGGKPRCDSCGKPVKVVRCVGPIKYIHTLTVAQMVGPLTPCNSTLNAHSCSPAWSTSTAPRTACRTTSALCWRRPPCAGSGAGAGAQSERRGFSQLYATINEPKCKKKKVRRTIISKHARSGSMCLPIKTSLHSNRRSSRSIESHTLHPTGASLARLYAGAVAEPLAQ